MREITIKLAIDWEDYSDVHPELILEDSGLFDGLKRGVSWQITEDNMFRKVGRAWVLNQSADQV